MLCLAGKRLGGSHSLRLLAKQRPSVALSLRRTLSTTSSFVSSFSHKPGASSPFNLDLTLSAAPVNGPASPLLPPILPGHSQHALVLSITADSPLSLEKSVPLHDRRRPVDLVCILDISGSMSSEASVITSDGKLETRTQYNMRRYKFHEYHAHTELHTKHACRSSISTYCIN